MQLSPTHAPQVYEGNIIRILEHDGQKWLYGADVSKALKRSTQALFRCVSPSGHTVIPFSTFGGKQRIRIFNEQGIQELEARARSEATQRFCQWAAHKAFGRTRPTEAPPAAPVCKPSGVPAGCPFGFLMQMIQQVQRDGGGCGCSGGRN